MYLVFIITFIVGLIGSITLRSIKFDTIDLYYGTFENAQLLMNLFMFLLIIGFIGISLVVI